MMGLRKDSLPAPFTQPLEAGAFTDAKLFIGEEVPRHAGEQHIDQTFQTLPIISAGAPATRAFVMLGNQRLKLPPKFIRDQLFHAASMQASTNLRHQERFMDSF